MRKKKGGRGGRRARKREESRGKGSMGETDWQTGKKAGREEGGAGEGHGSLIG